MREGLLVLLVLDGNRIIRSLGVEEEILQFKCELLFEEELGI